MRTCFEFLLLSTASLLFLPGCGSDNVTQPGPVTITGTISLDTINSLVGEGASEQSGTLTLVSSSKTTTATFSGAPASIAPSPSLSGPIRAVGDGIGAHLSLSGDTGGARAVTDGVFSDYAFELSNASESQTHRVTFRAVVTSTVSATGADAYAYADLSVRDAANAELFFSEHRIDTLNAGNDLDAVANSDVFWIDLAPKSTYRFTALQRQRGGALATGDYGSELDGFIVLENIE